MSQLIKKIRGSNFLPSAILILVAVFIVILGAYVQRSEAVSQMAFDLTIDGTGTFGYYVKTPQLWSTNNVSIGTSTPATKLHLYDNSSGPIITLSGLDNNYRGLAIKDTAYDQEKWFVGNNSSNNFVVRRFGTSDYLMILAGNGNVGVGTTDPQYKLDIQGSSRTSNSAFADYFTATYDVSALNGTLNGPLNIPSSEVYNIPDTDGSYLSSDYTLFIGATSATKTYYLPYASSYSYGDLITIVDNNDNNFYLARRGTNTINNTTRTLKLTCILANVTLRAESTNWRIINTGPCVEF